MHEKLLNSIKNFLKKLIPVSFARMDKLYMELKKQNDILAKQNAKLLEQNEELKDMILDLNKKTFKNKRDLKRSIDSIKGELKITHENTGKIKFELHEVHAEEQKIKLALQKVHHDSENIGGHCRILL